MGAAPAGASLAASAASSFFVSPPSSPPSSFAGAPGSVDEVALSWSLGPALGPFFLAPLASGVALLSVPPSALASS